MPRPFWDRKNDFTVDAEGGQPSILARLMGLSGILQHVLAQKECTPKALRRPARTMRKGGYCAHAESLYHDELRNHELHAREPSWLPR